MEYVNKVRWASGISLFLAVILAFGFAAEGQISVTIQLVDEVGKPLASYPPGKEPRNLMARYRYGGTWADWQYVKTDENGKFMVTIAPEHVGRWDGKITVSLHQNSLEKTVDPAKVNVFQAVRVNVNLKTCTGLITEVPGGEVAQGGGYWFVHGTTGPTGTVTFYTFPGKVKIRMTYNGVSEIKEGITVVAGTNEIDFIARYKLTITITPRGAGETSPPAGTHVFEACSEVSIGASAYPGYVFSRWEGPVSDPNAALTTVYLDGNKAVTAVFETGCAVDNEPPQITSPGDITVNVGPGTCGASVSFAATATDNCGTPTIRYYINSTEITSPYTFPVGTTTVKAVATDSAGNSSECTFTVTVVDNEKPKITCPVHLSEYPTDTGKCFASLSFEAQATDNCGVEKIEYFVDGTKLSFPYAFPVGITTVQVVATDIHGNTAGCSFDVKVVDKEPPTISCPGDVVVGTDPGCCYATNVDLGTPTVSDNCGVASVTNNAPTQLPKGETLVTWTVTDTSGNTATCTQKVLVVDNEPPTIRCPGDITVGNDLGKCGAVVTYSMTYSDNCPGAVLDQLAGLPSGSLFPVGTTTNTFKVTDASGNSVTCSFTVTVVDTEPPVLTCPSNKMVSTDPGKCYATVDPGMATATDNCPGVTVVGVRSDGKSLDEPYPKGVTTITWRARDAAGNEASCVQTITVTDTEKPVITLNGEAVMILECGVDSYTEPGATVSDNCCPGPLVITGTVDITKTGTYYIRYNAKDCSGNAADEVIRTVHVVDTQPPVIQGCPGNIVVANDPGKCGAVVGWVEPSARDACCLASFTSTHKPGDFFPVGITTVTYTAVDCHGNRSTCSFMVTVRDEEPPVNPSLSSSSHSAGVWTNNPDVVIQVGMASDNCGVDGFEYAWDQNPSWILARQKMVDENWTGGKFVATASGQWYFHLATVDRAGNWSEPVHLGPFAIDLEKPGVPENLSPPDGTVTNDTSPRLSWSAPGDPGGSGIKNYRYQVDDSPDFSSPIKDGYTSNTYYTPNLSEGTYWWRIRARDNAGNNGDWTVARRIIIDTTPPEIVCPQPIVQANDPGFCGAVVNWPEPVVNDNVGIASVSCSPSSGSVFPVGTTPVTCRAVDLAGNVTQCTFTVTVEDKEKPTIEGCPEDFVVSNDPGKCGAVVRWTEPIAWDNCGLFSLVASYKPGDFFPVGTTTVTYTATDIHGNSTTCAFKVTVEDREHPWLNCPGDQVRFTDRGQAVYTARGAEFDPVSWGDSCSGTLLTNDLNGGSTLAGHPFPTGETRVTWSVTDAAGHVTRCSFTVTVVDNESPQITCPGDITVNVDPRTCGASVSFAATATDNCGTPTIKYYIGSTEITSPYMFPVGETTVKAVATDSAGNSSECTFTVTVVDNEPPKVTCPVPLSEYPTDAGKCFTSLSFEAQATDNCGVAKIEYFVGGTKISFPYAFPVGITTVQVVATDVHGNTASSSFDVKVVDKEPPTIRCPGDVVVGTDPGCCYATNVDLGTPTVSDNCGVASVTNNAPTQFPKGETVVTWTVTDASGNSATCTQKVRVVDNEPPTISCPGDIRMNNDPGKCGAVVTYSVSYSDNCPGAVLEQLSGLPSGSLFPVGTTTNTFKVTDASGNTTICSFTITVKDTAPKISITKEADRASARVGETITYTITVRNTGNVNLANVVVTDPTLGALGGPAGDDGDNVLELTETWVYTGTYTVTTADVGRTISNAATATATDPCGKVVQATSNNVVVSWTNSPPRALRQTVRTCKNTPITFNLVGTDPDVDPDNPGLYPLTFDILGGPAHGILSGNLAAVTYSAPHQAAVSVTYAPAFDFLGTDTITFEVWDPVGFFAIGTVTITVESCGEELPAGGAAVYAPVVINEIAWAGTPASPEDQWIELLNVTDQPIDLTGWVIRWRRKFPTIPEEAEWKVVELRGVIPAQGYFLLERGHDDVVSDIPADLIYDTAPPYNLKFSPFGDIVELLDASGNVVDTANADRPERDGWIAGSAAPFFATMERIDPYDRDHEGNWATNRGIVVNGFNAKKSLLTATARHVNEKLLTQILAAQPTVTASLGETLTVTLELPTWAQEIPELPKLTLVRGATVDGVGAMLSLEELGEAVRGRRLAGLLNYEVTVDTTKLGEGVFQIWISLGKGVVHLLTLEIHPAS